MTLAGNARNSCGKNKQTVLPLPACAIHRFFSQYTRDVLGEQAAETRFWFPSIRWRAAHL